MMVFNRTLLNELDSTELEAAVCDICDKADDFDSTDVSIIKYYIMTRNTRTLAKSSLEVDSIHLLEVIFTG